MANTIDYTVDGLAINNKAVLTGIDDEANSNYAIGLNALDSVTLASGIKNIAIGKDAGTAITTGDNNIAIGTDALKLGSSITDCVAIGVSALATLVSGANDNIAIGTDALKLCTSAGNTVIGVRAGDALTNSASNNVLIGKDAGGALNAGDTQNVMIGESAGFATTDCDNAVFIGQSAGGDTSTGSRSVCIGRAAGINTGLDTIAIGYLAASSATTPVRCIIIGPNAEPITASSGADELVIGYGTAAQSVKVLSGKMGATSDVARGSDVFTITGPSAFPTAATNIDAGDLILQGGTAATTGNGIGGDAILQGGAKGSTGAKGYGLVNDTIYGIMSVQGGVTSQDNIDTTPIITTAWNTDGIANGMTVSHANNYITALVAGVYEVNVSASFSGTALSVVHMEIYVYDASGVAWGASGFDMTRKLGTSGDVGSTSIHGLVTLDVSDRVAVYITTDGATDDVTITDAQLVCKRISG